MSNYQAVVAEGMPVPSGALLLWPDKNLRTGEGDFSNAFGDMTTLESDVLRVASSIYACDLAFRRGEREDIVRSIDLVIPVVNHQAFKSVKDELELALWLLSDDNWSIKFKRREGTPEPAKKWPVKKGKTILFSGGVDSFAGAAELMEQNGAEAVHLVSHFTANLVTRQSQKDLYGYIERNLGKPVWTAVRTGGKKTSQAHFPSDREREDTQRTRSFMFLAIAALAARRSGHRELVMIAENGQMAIHLPLSAARIGAFSTHTAHPEFVRRMAALLNVVLDTQLTLENPYLYMTKGEVVSRVATKHGATLGKAVSCWRGSRLSQSNHCGECVPCLIRRIAFEKNSIKLNEYERDLLAEDVPALPESDEGKRNLVELIEFAYAFLSRADRVLEDTFPGLINPDINITKAIAMYRRFAGEAEAVLKRYRGPAGLLKRMERGKR